MLGRMLQPGDLVTLTGELGAGKTTLAQGVGEGLQVEEPVTSPTFNLLQIYDGRLPFWHLDAYRLHSPEELEDLCWHDPGRSRGVTLVEWPCRLEEALPPERLEIELSEQPEEDCRLLAFLARGPQWAGRLEELARRTAEQGC